MARVFLILILYIWTSYCYSEKNTVDEVSQTIKDGFDDQEELSRALPFSVDRNNLLEKPEILIDFDWECLGMDESFRITCLELPFKRFFLTLREFVSFRKKIPDGQSFDIESIVKSEKGSEFEILLHKFFWFVDFLKEYLMETFQCGCPQTILLGPGQLLDFFKFKTFRFYMRKMLILILIDRVLSESGIFSDNKRPKDFKRSCGEVFLYLDVYKFEGSLTSFKLELCHDFLEEVKFQIDYILQKEGFGNFVGWTEPGNQRSGFLVQKLGILGSVHF